MTGHRCCCGFSARDATDLTDHLGEMYLPADDTGIDGKAHAETVPGTCLCGLAAADTAELDAHLLAAFTPAHGIGHDGRRHVAASTR